MVGEYKCSIMLQRVISAGLLPVMHMRCNGQGSSLYEPVRSIDNGLSNPRRHESHLTKLSPVSGPMANRPGMLVDWWENTSISIGLFLPMTAPGTRPSWCPASARKLKSGDAPIRTKI